MNLNINVIIILVAFVVAILAICILYAIIIPKDDLKREKEFQLTTKNILEHVKILFDQGEYALVQLLATEYLKRMPSHVEVRRYLANAFFKDKKYNNTIKQCLILLRLSPNDMLTKQMLGDSYVKKGMLSKAIKEYEEIIEKKSDNKEVLRSLADLYKDTEQYYSAISAYNMLSELLTDNADIADLQSTLAELNEEVHDYPAAFEAYKTRLGIYPTDVETNKKLVELYIKLKNSAKAIETLLYMLSFVTEPKQLLWVNERLIELYVETEEYEKAIEYSNKMLDIQGADKFKIRENIASYYLKLGKYDTSIGILEDLVMMSQSAYDVTVELAAAYIEQKEYEKALEKYTALLDKATQKEAKNVRSLICELYIKWASEKTEQGSYEESNKYLNLALEFDALSPEVYYCKAVNHFEKKDYAACVEMLHRAIEYDKFKTHNIKYLTKLAETHNKLGNFFEEKKALSDLLKVDPKNPIGLYHTGLMYVSQHDSKNAEDYFLQAIEADPDFIRAKYSLALLYESNNREKAKELYTEVLDADPTFVEARNALSDLLSSEY